VVAVVVAAVAVDLVEGAAVLVLVAVAVLAPAVVLARVAVLSALLRCALPALHRVLAHRVRAHHGSTSLHVPVWHREQA
jgi:hypothetical protein